MLNGHISNEAHHIRYLWEQRDSLQYTIQCLLGGQDTLTGTTNVNTAHAHIYRHTHTCTHTVTHMLRASITQVPLY